MDGLRDEFKTVKRNRKKLEAFFLKISNLRFLDPACGCGNFLVVAFKELRVLELEVLQTLIERHYNVMEDTVLSVAMFRKRGIQLSNFYGVEIEESSALIARTAMWLTDHQINKLLEKTFDGQYKPDTRLPKGASIHLGNALKMDWKKTFPDVNYIIGNPPFIGKHLQNDAQKADIELIFKSLQGSGNLDYVTCWHKKAAVYMDAYPSVKTAFVSTNSISQGEQVGVLWKDLFETHKIKILFAHQTFKWNNEAKGVAAVHCVIIGFAPNDTGFKKAIFEYADIKEEPTRIDAKNINPYLVEGKDLWIESRAKPMCDVPKMMAGNKAIDGGNLIFSDEEKEKFIKIEPLSKQYFKRFIGSEEFINGKSRWCLWLVNIAPNVLQKMPNVLKRVQNIKELREKSPDAQARQLANFPTTFRDKHNPDFAIVIPLVSSERRPYIPFGFIDSETIPSNLCSFIPDATMFLFGVLCSKMHMAWVQSVCGRLESRYRYSNNVVYNNYPFPQNVSAPQKQKVETAAQTVLTIREKYAATGSSLADMYDPLSMPSDLRTAHDVLDKAVDDCYGKTRFSSESKRIGFLFDLYAEYIEKEKEEVPKGKRGKK